MTDPLTEAGRSLFSRLWAVNDYAGASKAIATVAQDIVAIEAEMFERYRPLTEAVDALLAQDPELEALPEEDWDQLFIKLRDARARLEAHRD